MLFQQSVISHIDGHKHQILAVSMLVCVHENGEQPGLWKHHLSCSTPPPFDKEFNVEALFNQHANIFGKELGIELCSLKGPPDEKGPALSKEGSHGPEGQVTPSSHMGARHVVGKEKVGKDKVIEMALVTRDKNKGGLGRCHFYAV